MARPANKSKELTEHQRNFILANYGKLRMAQIYKHLHLSPLTVYKFLQEKGIATRNTKTGSSYQAKKRVTQEGIFDEFERDWFIG